MFHRVKEFHRIFGQNIAEFAALPIQSERDLRISLLQEEVNEFCKAFVEDDIIEMADGLADICYIIAGTCVSYGICPQESVDYPYEDIIDQMTLFFNIKLDRLVREDFQSYLTAEQGDNLPAIQDALMMMLTSVFGVALHLGIPLKAVFAEVHKSNLSKAMPDGSVLYREDGKILKSDYFCPPDIASIMRNRVNTISA